MKTKPDLTIKAVEEILGILKRNIWTANDDSILVSDCIARALIEASSSQKPESEEMDWEDEINNLDEETTEIEHGLSDKQWDKVRVIIRKAISTAVKEAEARIVKNLIHKHGLSRSVKEVLEVIQQTK